MKNKRLMVSLLFLSFSMNCFTQDFSSALYLGENRKNSPDDFQKSKAELINFHLGKAIDHQKVADCLTKTADFESMNLCNKHLEKYFKKNAEKK
jgi:hypothetical protein